MKKPEKLVVGQIWKFDGPIYKYKAKIKSLSANSAIMEIIETILDPDIERQVGFIVDPLISSVKNNGNFIFISKAKCIGCK